MAVSKLEYLLTIIFQSDEEIKTTSCKIQNCKNDEKLFQLYSRNEELMRKNKIARRMVVKEFKKKVNRGS